MFYVYEHWRPDTNSCFYVGKGKGNRAWVMNLRNNHHKSIQSKLTSLGLSVNVKIIVENLSEETAFFVEKDLIAFYGRENLTNMTDGGEGPSGREGLKGNKSPNYGKPSSFKGKTHTNEAKKILSDKMKGKKTRLGAKLSDETKAKISTSHIGKTSPLKGVPKLEETKKKISVTLSKSIMGNKNPFFGKKHTEETKRKISETKRRNAYGA